MRFSRNKIQKLLSCKNILQCVLPWNFLDFKSTSICLQKQWISSQPQTPFSQLNHITWTHFAPCVHHRNTHKKKHGRPSSLPLALNTRENNATITTHHHTYTTPGGLFSPVPHCTPKRTYKHLPPLKSAKFTPRHHHHHQQQQQAVNSTRREYIGRDNPVKSIVWHDNFGAIVYCCCVGIVQSGPFAVWWKRHRGCMYMGVIW